MKVLLLGDFSGFHVNIAQGLRELGIQVTVASAGDYWKNFERDIDLMQPDKFKRIRFIGKLIKAYPKLCGYDVVQLIHPNFLGTSPFLNDLVFSSIKNRNGKIFLGANGSDYYYCKYAIEGNLKYSPFQFPQIKKDPFVKGLRVNVENKRVIAQNIRIANYASGITACSVGYYKAYYNSFPDKTVYIPYPINTTKYPYVSTISNNPDKVRFFLGKMKGREVRKGVDVIERVLNRLKKKYPNDVALKIVSSVPFSEYEKLLNQSHILCDQLYSYVIAMNGMVAQSKGLIACGGADEELYKLLGEYDNRPIVDINHDEDGMLSVFEQLIDQKHKLKEHALNSRKFVVKHHNHVKVAQEYVDFWNKMK